MTTYYAMLMRSYENKGFLARGWQKRDDKKDERRELGVALRKMEISAGWAGMNTKAKMIKDIKILTPKNSSSFISSWQALARPRVFLKITGFVLPIALTLMALSFAIGLYLSLVGSPPDYQQGEAVRIMYVHVPASWMALMVYGFLALMSLFVLVWRHPLAEVLAISAVPIGALFTSLSLVTGSLWGRPMWGTFWVWDGRITSVFILLLLYGGYWALYKTYSRPDRGIRAASLLALIGVINLPIIKGSVDWWNTLHQPASIAKFGPSSIHASMLMPLFLMAGAYFFYFVSVLILVSRGEIERRKRHASSVIARPHRGRGNPEAKKNWVASSLSLLAMTLGGI